jgi:hypothetical protein
MRKRQPSTEEAEWARLLEATVMNEDPAVPSIPPSQPIQAREPQMAEQEPSLVRAVQTVATVMFGALMIWVILSMMIIGTIFLVDFVLERI